MSLRLRLILLLLAVYSLGGWLITEWSIRQVRPRYFEAMEETMVETAMLLAGVMEAEKAVSPTSIEVVRTIVENAAREPYEARIFSLVREDFGLRVLVADADGRVLYDSSGEARGQVRLDWDEISRTLAGTYGARSRFAARSRPLSSKAVPASEGLELNEIYVGAPIHRDGSIVGVVSIGKSTASIDTLVRAAQLKISLGMVVGGVALLLVLLLVANWVVGPLEGFVRWARAVRDGERLPDPKAPGGTLGALKDAMIEMRASLDGQDAAERYTRTLAHEIKAPLTAIRGSAELLEEDLPPEERARFEEAMRDGVDRIQRIVDEMLARSQLESQRGGEGMERIDYAEAVREAVEALRPGFAAAAVTLEVELGEKKFEGPGNRALLGRAVLNLLQNALEFSRPESVVKIALRRSGGGIVLRVDDCGVGIPAYAEDRIFERFYSLPRPASGRKSTGLGLGLVREIMEVLGGSVAVSNRPGGGVRAELRWR